MPYLTKQKRTEWIEQLLREKGPMGCQQLAKLQNTSRSTVYQVIAPLMGVKFKMVATHGNGPYGEEAKFDVIDSSVPAWVHKPVEQLVQAQDVIAKAMRAMVTA